MKTLILVRHAKSSWDHDDLRDFDRPLNDRGLHDAPEMAAYLKEQNIIPDVIVTSPALRAYTTAQIMAQTLQVVTSQILTPCDGIYEGHSQNLLDVISKTPRAHQVMMLVGHNPSITNLANNLTHQFIENVPTCGVLTIDFDVDDWQQINARGGVLNRFVSPKSIRQQ